MFLLTSIVKKEQTKSQLVRQDFPLARETWFLRICAPLGQGCPPLARRLLTISGGAAVSHSSTSAGLFDSWAVISEEAFSEGRMGVAFEVTDSA